ncbi:hypothetical protein F443_06007 [Phytophthora nicotianae P1569]|uniref:Uncharacterized protein n=1 Tax=Phytophthora nicotianae P1569 TaxID=1317065 RepID=V9FG77_PHYNI|nr:hypothetical protein F443_06007 [Phytophthora nicotianae P1569]
MERDDSANALSVIEEGDEQDLNAEAFADMAMSGMDMNLELNTLQIDRNGAFSAAVQPTGTQTKRSAYEELKNGAVYYSRREDKMQVLQEHPVVASVSSDGRSVGCKCGRSVRLNPPWYILKFEQHVASRNCTFLRQSRPRKRKRPENKDTRKGDADDQETQEAEIDDDNENIGEYSLQSVDAILRREFGVVHNDQRHIEPPSDDSPDHRVRMFKGAMTLRENPHFKRITPDGKFVECKCARIVLLGAPWQPGQFLMHVADKQKPKKRAKPASAVANEEWKKKRIATSPAMRTMISGGVLMRPPTSASALLQAYKSKKSFPREIRWDVARERGFLPCPGLRDERMNTFVTSAIQLTGGARHRQKIARELFPHLFPDNAEYDHADEPGNGDLDHSSTTHKRHPKLQQLLEAEKLLLHDVIEGEALWFVDKDGNSVRSLDCLGVVESSKGEDRCASCTALRSNAVLRTAAAAKYKVATRPGPPRNPINRKFCSGRVCSLLEAEFDMQEPYARVLRDLALADIPIALNTWMEMATMGLSGDFDSHSALLGLTEAMVRLKDKEQRGVGLQNMTYSDLLDSFMRSLADLSPEACELFQRHLGGRKQRQLLATTSRPHKRKLQPITIKTGQDQPGDSLYDGTSSSTAVRATSDDGFVHLLDPSVVGLSMPHLSIGDIQDVDLTSFPTSSAMQTQSSNSEATASAANSATPSESYQLPTIQQSRSETEKRNDVAIDSVSELTSTALGREDHEETVDAEEQMESDPAAVAFLSELAPSDGKDISTSDEAVMPTDHVPCTGLRDENVQAYVSNAVQLVGGSRPRYVIARELFPQVFGNDKKVRIVDKLNEEQRLMLQDAVFSECLWRVDKEGRCVRSLRCKRFVPATDNQNRGNQSHGVCRACRDLRTVPNFRSVLSRSKAPKKLENIKYVPSVYTESDPFLRKLSKNSAFRGLYQTVKRMVSPGSGGNSDVDAERVKQVHFWLRFARMGVFGHFKSHPVFEGLMKSMVEVKDKERRGVGKQNMQYSRALDEFMQSMAQISTEAFELFAGQFCGRTLRSQKVKRRSTSATLTTPVQTSIGAESAPVKDTGGAVDPPTHQPLSSPTHQHQHYLMPPDDLLSGRSLSSEESQRFMDRMMDEVRLSVSREMELAEEERRASVGNSGDIEQHTNDEDESNRLGPETYLDDEGVLTTEI